MHIRTNIKFLWGDKENVEFQLLMESYILFLEISELGKTIRTENPFELFWLAAVNQFMSHL